MGAAIAQWIRLRQTLCGHGFDSEGQFLSFFNSHFNCDERRTKKQKRPGLSHLKNPFKIHIFHFIRKTI